MVGEEVFIMSEDTAIVEIAIDIPFVVRGRQTRLVPAEWAKRMIKEFQELGVEAPKNLHPFGTNFSTPGGDKKEGVKNDG